MYMHVLLCTIWLLFCPVIKKVKHEVMCCAHSGVLELGAAGPIAIAM